MDERPPEDPNNNNQAGLKQAAGEDDAQAQQQRRVHEVFGDPLAGGLALIVMLAQLIAYTYRDPCTC